MIVKDLGMEQAKPVTTPSSSQDARDLAAVLDENGQVPEDEFMNDEEATKYRSVAARMNYLALDRSDLQQACRCICAHMAKPLRGCCQMIKRATRYVAGRPRCIQLFPFENVSSRLLAYADSDWAGDKMTRKSTSGGVLMLGSSLLKSWSSVQTTIAMSSGEAELYAMIKAACQMKYLMSIAKDLGMDLQGLVRTDSTAALAISQRSGLGGRTRHVQVQYLWIQESLKNKQFCIGKVASEDNVPDILTKSVPSDVFNKHLATMGYKGVTALLPALCSACLVGLYSNMHSDICGIACGSS